MSEQVDWKARCEASEKKLAALNLDDQAMADDIKPGTLEHWTALVARAEAAEARVIELTTVKENRGMSVNDGRVECPTCGDYVDGSITKFFAPLRAENAALRERVASYEAKLLADTALMNKANEALHHVTRLYAAEGEKLAASERALEEVTCHQKDCTGLLLNLEDEFHSAEEKLGVALSKLDAPSRSAGGTIARTADDGERRGNIHGKKLGVE